MVRKAWSDGVVKLWEGPGGWAVVLYDPISGWICGEKFGPDCNTPTTQLQTNSKNLGEQESTTAEKQLAEKLALFLLQACLDFGFLDLELINFRPQLFDDVSAYFRKFHDFACESVPELRTCLPSFIFSDQDKPLPIDDQAVQNLVASVECEKEEETISEGYLSQFKLMIIKQRFRTTEGSTPLQRLCSRELTGLVTDRRPVKAPLLVCRYCQVSFTSRVSFRIHQRNHMLSGCSGDALVDGQLPKTEESDDDDDYVASCKARRPGTRKSKKLRKSRVDRLVRGLEQEEEAGPAVLDQDRLTDNVQAVLRVTDPERNRRGEYMCLSAAAKDEIAEYAIQHGEQAAIKNFVLKNGQHLSQSHVRNLVKIYEQYKPELRKQIGEYARVNGLAAAVQHFSKLLGRDVRKSSVRRFRALYSVRKTGAGVRGETEAYSLAVKQEIGRYAAIHGVEAAASVYSQKLQMVVKPLMVRKFRRLYGKTDPVNNDTSTTIDLLHSSINVLNQGEDGFYTIQYSADGPGQQPAELQYFSAQAVEFTVPVNTMQEVGQKILPAQQLSQLNQHVENNETTTVETAEELQDTTYKKSGAMQETKAASHVPSQSDEAKQKSKKTRYERGSYVQYSSEMRARIGKYAAQHGNVAAVRHFTEELGRVIPESTIRTMRDKYLALSQKKGRSVTEVSTKVRGRASVLGAHDKILLDTLVRLQERGEKITQFAIVAAAKQILIEAGEEGWELNLTPSWARSVLRRLNNRNKTT